jgi:glycerophosphoryl diester phosphodiesterase
VHGVGGCGASLVSERSFSQGSVSLVVAHRGASATEAENTLPAFAAAVAAGADVVEFDVRITADGEAVVMHDVDVSRTTDGQGRVRDLTLDEIKRLRIQTRDGGSTGVPTLEEALRYCSSRVGVDIEIKNIPGEPGYDAGREVVAEQVVKLLDKFAFDGPVLITSFNPATLGRIRDLAPAAVTGFLSTEALDPRSALALAVDQGHAFVLPQAEAVEAAGAPFVRECRAAGVRVGTWTVDHLDRMARLFGMGVDAVATNDPAAAVPIREAARAGRQP